MFPPISMVWSLDSLGWCARPFALCLAAHLSKSVSHHFSSISSAPAIQAACHSPKGQDCSCLLVFAWAVPSLGNALPHVLCLAQSLRWFLLCGTALFPSPHTAGRDNLLLLARLHIHLSLAPRMSTCQATRNLSTYFQCSSKCLLKASQADKLIAKNVFQSPSSPTPSRVPQSWLKCHADLHLLRQWRQAGEQGELCCRENIRE